MNSSIHISSVGYFATFGIPPSPGINAGALAAAPAATTGGDIGLLLDRSAATAAAAFAMLSGTSSHMPIKEAHT